MLLLSRWRPLVSCSRMQWYSYSANVTGLLHVKVCSDTFTPTFVLRTDAFSSSGGGIAQLAGCGSCETPLT